MKLGPIEAKVYVSAGGASVVGLAALWLMGVLIWHVPNGAGDAEKAIAAVPYPIAALVMGLVTVAAGYLAPHTPRLPAAVVSRQTTGGTTLSTIPAKITYVPTGTTSSVTDTPDPPDPATP